MISTKGRYALRVMIDLAIHSCDGYVTLREIAERQEISMKYLEQIISLMNKAGFLHSLRGNAGGYRLSRAPEEYTAGDILRASEGSIAPIECLREGNPGCGRSIVCPTRKFWQGYFDVINSYVDSRTLADLVDEAIAAQKQVEEGQAL